jgi:beta-lactamase superfamily II metal-dependent hydrolase
MPRFPRFILLALALLATRAVAQDSARVELIFLDVGQGDAVLVRGPQGKTALIDAGPRGAHVADQLAELGVDTIHLVVASHGHADHIGGLEAVLRRFPVRAYLDNELPHTTQTYRSLMAWVERTRARDSALYLRPTARTISLGELRFRVLPPPDWAPDHNDRSVGLLLEFGEFRALFPGDAEGAGLAHFVAQGLPRVTVLKASHHGARNGVSREWLQAVRPSVVVISVGVRNAYGHPDPWALDYYGGHETPVYRTDIHGRIVIRGARDGTHEVTTQHVP